MVDDDDPYRDFVVNALMYCVNRDVVSFENAHAAWGYIDDCSNNTDIVVSDTDMPEMDGFELISRIKKKYPEKICILMSGNPANEKTAIDLGADAFLAKPFSINDLFGIVQTFVVGESA